VQVVPVLPDEQIRGAVRQGLLVPGLLGDLSELHEPVEIEGLPRGLSLLSVPSCLIAITRKDVQSLDVGVHRDTAHVLEWPIPGPRILVDVPPQQLIEVQVEKLPIFI